MGMYTELVMACELDKASDKDANILYRMIDGCDREEPGLPEHRLFSTTRWHYMLQSDSYYFVGKTMSDIFFDHIAKHHILTVRCNLKNYDYEIEEFCNWVRTLTSNRGFVGYMRYESAENPTLIYFTDMGVEYR